MCCILAEIIVLSIYVVFQERMQVPQNKEIIDNFLAIVGGRWIQKRRGKIFVLKDFWGWKKNIKRIGGGVEGNTEEIMLILTPYDTVKGFFPVNSTVVLYKYSRFLSYENRTNDHFFEYYYIGRLFRTIISIINPFM